MLLQKNKPLELAQFKFTDPPSLGEFKMEEFSVLRIEALIMCCVRAPACIADYLCYQFYEENYTVVTRLDILEVG